MSISFWRSIEIFQGTYNVTIRRIPLAFAAATTLSVETVSVNGKQKTLIKCYKQTEIL